MSEQPTIIGRSKTNKIGFKAVRGGATGLDIILDEEEEIEEDFVYENSVIAKNSDICFFHGRNDH